MKMIIDRAGMGMAEKCFSFIISTIIVCLIVPDNKLIRAAVFLASFVVVSIGLHRFFEFLVAHGYAVYDKEATDDEEDSFKRDGH
ncbi:hypothetical protein C4J81_13680 [Deltaproteobacteria bacterium Smac51]|nr:hypothetical protein C4J81_13680 [Deltaproteobacteria bacterium Smac51]